MRPNDLNSKMTRDEFDIIIDELETNLEAKADNTVATISDNGLMSSSDKSKLDSIERNANNYSHPNTSGNKHIPSGGSTGQILKWNQDGTASWSNPSLYGVAFESEDGDVVLPSSDNIKSEVFPGGGELNINH